MASPPPAFTATGKTVPGNGRRHPVKVQCDGDRLTIQVGSYRWVYAELQPADVCLLLSGGPTIALSE